MTPPCVPVDRLSRLAFTETDAVIRILGDDRDEVLCAEDIRLMASEILALRNTLDYIRRRAEAGRANVAEPVDVCAQIVCAIRLLTDSVVEP